MSAVIRRLTQSKLLSISILLCTVLLVISVFRRPIAIQTIEHFASSQNIQVSCLDFSFNWRLTLNIQRACLNSPAAKLVVQNASWQPWTHTLDIERLRFKHLAPFAPDNLADTEQTDTPPTELLELISSLPQIHIASLELDSYTLLQPIRLAVDSSSHKQLTVAGAVHATIDITGQALIVNANWRLTDLSQYIPQAQQLLKDNATIFKDAQVQTSQIATTLTYNGKDINVDNHIHLSSRLSAPSCSIDAKIQGKLLAHLDIEMSELELDLSRLNNTIIAADCPLLQEYVDNDNLPQLSFSLPQTIHIDPTQIQLPELTIETKHGFTTKTLGDQPQPATITIRPLRYQSTGELTFSYQISIKQPLQSKPLAAKMFDLQGSGDVEVDLSSLISSHVVANRSNSGQQVNFKIEHDKHRLVLHDVQFEGLTLEQLLATFSFEHKPPNSSNQDLLTLAGSLDSSNLHAGELQIGKITSLFSVTGTHLQNVKLALVNQVSQLKHPQGSIKKISNHLDLTLNSLNQVNFSANTSVTGLSTQNIRFMPISAAHSGHGALSERTLSSQHKIMLEQGFEFDMQQQQGNVNIQLKSQPIAYLQPVLSQIDDALTISQGTLGADFAIQLPQDEQPLITTGQVNIQHLQLQYQDYQVNNVTYQTPLTYDPAGLQIIQSNLHIESIDVGVPIRQVSANLIAKNSQLSLKQVQGEIFSGQFSLAELHLDGQDQQFKVNFKDIDLAQVVALQQQPGINITGTVNGELPIVMDQQGIKIEDGWMTSLTGGKLTITDNPYFDSIKSQQPQLALLENLNFTQLESKVKFNPEGWVFFDFALQGNNPDKTKVSISIITMKKIYFLC
ncbi:YdbH domain-containing protein [Paraglaciecola aquimarina]|uniref:YdbH domain-containing protein n=1 Tax=Paraglaciecola aquimarina TaxID=1235557 RepID=A0ABU3T2C1_9ALTE|nr:YdbH domain-containing protein [Paraglaciecola aquimarina]MDU0356404.1 YdbH domain-containing protein [Paraglaciecola aquimarina]